MSHRSSEIPKEYSVPVSADARYRLARDPETVKQDIHDFGHTPHAGTSFQAEVLQPVTELLGESTLALDVGSGLGELANWLETHQPQTRVVRLDLQPEALQAQHHPLTVEARGNILPFADSGFDLITCKDVLPHIYDKAQALREYYRVLKPGGLSLLVTQPVGWSGFTYELPSSRGDFNFVKVKTPDLFEREVQRVLEMHPDAIINPQYYKTLFDTLLDIASEQGFTILDAVYWAPAEGETDWHEGEAVQRAVIVLQKPLG